jgi:hypothetical protein
MPELLRTPQPLTSTEIKEGITDLIAAAVDATEELRNAIRLSLDRTCSLNSTSYAKFKSSWNLTRDRLGCEWLVKYELDDFGRLVIGQIGGNTGFNPSTKLEQFEGEIEPMPPDAFRRKTAQKIPVPILVQKKQGNGPGLTKSWRQIGRGKKTA